jgi:hypothetical protein
MPRLERTFVPAGLFVATLTVMAYRATAQDSAQIDFYGAETARYAGGVLTVEILDNGQGWAGTMTARLADLDVEQVEVEGNYDGSAFSIDLPCKGGATCVPRRGHYVGLQLPGNGPPNWDAGVISVNCRTRSQCESLLNAFRASSKPPARPPDPTRTQPQLPAPANPPPQARVNPAPSSSAPAAAPDSPFRDVFDGITWQHGSTTTLDDLANKTKPTPKPPRLPTQQPTYVAFAQSAGFDANSQYGFATSKDLNTAVGQANVNCVSRATTSCGDEGYCMLRPGQYGAWASDRKYLGAKGFACNLKTEDDAVNQALAWCGSDQCLVLWTGAGD